MSACVSRHGEYSAHEPDRDHICALCGAVDYDALAAERDAAVARAEAARGVHGECSTERCGHHGDGQCHGCDRALPCPTLQALDGGEG